MSVSRAIMLVEDDEGHALLFTKQLRRRGIRNPIHHFVTGSSALAWLQTPMNSVDAPQLIVLDINLPDIPGTDVLAHIANRPDINAIPVVMLTSSDDQADAELSFALGCRHYMIKPLQVEHFVEVCADLGYPLALEPTFAPQSSGVELPRSPPADRETSI